MSEENVEIVRRVYEEVSANLWDAPSELFDPEYEVDLTDAGLPPPRSFCGSRIG